LKLLFKKLPEKAAFFIQTVVTILLLHYFFIIFAIRFILNEIVKKMEIKKMKTQNIYQIKNLPTSEESEILSEILNFKNTKIERIISTGQVTPAGKWYNQPSDEWVILLQGNATIEFENAEYTQLSKGDYLLIPAHRKHRVSFTSSAPPCIWLAVHML